MKKTFCFDIDNTICKTVRSDYKKSKPILKNINCINDLYNQGHIIKIYTARFMGRTNDNSRLATKKAKKITLNQLKKWGCKYHKLSVGEKPPYDLLICDKSKRIEEI